MPGHHVIPLIVIHRRVPIHNLRKDIPTNLVEIRAKQPTDIWLKPIQTRQELMDIVLLVPLYQVALVEPTHNVGLLVIHVGDRPESKVLID